MVRIEARKTKKGDKTNNQSLEGKIEKNEGREE
jgi:hypothetical protein